MTRYLYRQEFTVTREERFRLNGHKGAVLWFTGLSGSGKSTIANLVDYELYQYQCQSYILDGDNIRQGLNQDLGFSDADRIENLRRIGEVSKLFVDSGKIVLTAFISPFAKERERLRQLIGEDFIEVYVKCPLEICEKRDPKGLYQKARQGLISQFTGIDSPYEPPSAPELVLETDKESIEESVEKVLRFLKEREIIH